MRTKAQAPQSEKIILVVFQLSSIYNELQVYSRLERKLKKTGTQFDPKYADIMLEIIKEDKDYTLREKQDEKQERLQ